MCALSSLTSAYELGVTFPSSNFCAGTDNHTDGRRDPLPTPDSPPIATLPIEAARTRLLELLSNNGECVLPCLWGIAPGETSVEEALTTVLPLSGLSEITGCLSSVCTIIPSIKEGEQHLHVALSLLYNEAGIVTAMEFHARQLYTVPAGEKYGQMEVYGSQSFAERAAFYMLPNVLSLNGIPASVMISTSGGSPNGEGTRAFDILLMYPDDGLLVNYVTQAKVLGDKLLGCPSPSDGNVEMELFPPGHESTFMALLEQTDWPLKLSLYRPLQDVSSLSVEEFFEVFRDGLGQ